MGLYTHTYTIINIYVTITTFVRLPFRLLTILCGSLSDFNSVNPNIESVIFIFSVEKHFCRFGSFKHFYFCLVSHLLFVKNYLWITNYLIYSMNILTCAHIAKITLPKLSDFLNFRNRWHKKYINLTEKFNTIAYFFFLSLFPAFFFVSAKMILK